MLADKLNPEFMGLNLNSALLVYNKQVLEEVNK